MLSYCFISRIFKKLGSSSVQVLPTIFNNESKPSCRRPLKHIGIPGWENKSRMVCAVNKMNFFTGFFSKPLLFATLGTLLLAGGCAQMPGVAKEATPFHTGPQMTAENLPDYVVGESFIFDDGRTDTVIEIDGEKITWRDDRGIIRWIHRNFLLPDIAWQNRTRRSSSTTTADAKMLWPLQVGASGRFDYKQSVDANDASTHNEYKQSWQCLVEGTLSLDVPAGTFNVFKIPCYRYLDGTSFWRQTRTFYYAPEVGHYVKRTDTYASRPSRQRELVSYGFNSTALPGNEQAILINTVQKVLNDNADGMATTWNRPDGSLSATLTPLRSFQGANGVACREYQSTYQFKDRKRVNYRTVCKQETGLWQRVP